MELFLTLLFTVWLVCQLLLIPTIFFVLSLFRRIQSQTKRRLRKIALVVLVGTIIWVPVTTMEPPLLWKNVPVDKTAAEETIRYVADGDYCGGLPFFIPVLVTADETFHDGLRWQTYYLPFGWTEHVYYDTYECTKPLSPW